MKRLIPLLNVVLFAAPLLAQSAHSNVVKEERYSLTTLTKYCSAAETFSKSQQPRVFAQVSSGLGPSLGWVEFSSRADWTLAGMPQPLAFVWYKDDRVSRVAISAHSEGGNGQSYADYCYRPDGRLARLRSVPETQTDCDSVLFHCKVTLRGERLYPPSGELAKLSTKRAEKRPSFVAQLDELSLNALAVRPLESERTSLSFPRMTWPEYLTVDDLPFNQLLYVSTK